MSVSTDGQIGYGVIFEDGCEFPWGDSDPEQWWRNECGFKSSFPVELVNYCSGDYPMYMLAVPSSILSNSRGYPEEFDPIKLVVTDKEKAPLIDFCKKYNLKYEKGLHGFLLAIGD